MEVVEEQVHQPHANGFCENQAQRTASLLEASSCQVFCFQNIKLHTSTKHVASTQSITNQKYRTQKYKVLPRHVMSLQSSSMKHPSRALMAFLASSSLVYMLKHMVFEIYTNTSTITGTSTCASLRYTNSRPSETCSHPNIGTENKNPKKQYKCKTPQNKSHQPKAQPSSRFKSEE